jgi:hypothetical protein
VKKAENHKKIQLANSQLKSLFDLFVGILKQLYINQRFLYTLPKKRVSEQGYGDFIGLKRIGAFIIP